MIFKLPIQMNLNDLKKLAGVTLNYENPSIDNSINKRMIEKTNNIQPGTDEWFQLWFGSEHPKLNMPIGFRGRKK